MVPGRQSGDEHQDQDHDENGSRHWRNLSAQGVVAALLRCHRRRVRWFARVSYRAITRAGGRIGGIAHRGPFVLARRRHPRNARSKSHRDLVTPRALRVARAHARPRQSARATEPCHDGSSRALIQVRTGAGWSAQRRMGDPSRRARAAHSTGPTDAAKITCAIRISSTTAQTTGIANARTSGGAAPGRPPPKAARRRGRS